MDDRLGRWMNGCLDWTRQGSDSGHQLGEGQYGASDMYWV